MGWYLNGVCCPNKAAYGPAQSAIEFVVAENNMEGRKQIEDFINYLQSNNFSKHITIRNKDIGNRIKITLFVRGKEPNEIFEEEDLPREKYDEIHQALLN